LGGCGSGEWRLDVKTTVEDCRFLDVSRWVREGVLRPERYRRGLWAWYKGGEKTSSIGYEVDTTDMAAPRFRLFYTFTDSGEKVDETARLDVTRPHFGGVRFWFTCLRCGRRVGKLYLPPGRRRFRCRRCYDLTYTSCRECHKYDRLYASIALEVGLPPAVVKRVIRG